MYENVSNTMNLSSDRIEFYCQNNSTPPSELLQKIERETHLKTTQANMISGHILGHFYGEIMHMMQVKQALEIGTFTGYSSICIAENLPSDGLLTTIEVNPETHWLANQFFAEFQHPEKINSICADAKDIIGNSDIIWDFVLIDAGKKHNGLYYDMVLPKLRKGGIIIVDNVIWKAKTVQESKDKVTQIIDSFNQKIVQDSRVTKLMLPIRDGITIIRKL